MKGFHCHYDYACYRKGLFNLQPFNITIDISLWSSKMEIGSCKIGLKCIELSKSDSFLVNSQRFPEQSLTKNGFDGPQ